MAKTAASKKTIAPATATAKKTPEPTVKVKVVHRSPEVNERFKQKWLGKPRGERIAMKLEHVVELIGKIDLLVAPLPVEYVGDAHQLVRGTVDLLKAAAEKVRDLPQNYRKPGGGSPREPLKSGDLVTFRKTAHDAYVELLGAAVEKTHKVHEVKANGKFITLKIDGIGPLAIRAGHVKRAS